MSNYTETWKGIAHSLGRSERWCRYMARRTADPLPVFKVGGIVRRKIRDDLSDLTRLQFLYETDARGIMEKVEDFSRRAGRETEQDAGSLIVIKQFEHFRDVYRLLAGQDLAQRGVLGLLEGLLDESMKILGRILHGLTASCACRGNCRASRAACPVMPLLVVAYAGKIRQILGTAPEVRTRKASIRSHVGHLACDHAWPARSAA